MAATRAAYSYRLGVAVVVLSRRRVSRGDFSRPLPHPINYGRSANKGCSTRLVLLVGFPITWSFSPAD